jgi:hypothetical protein
MGRTLVWIFGRGASMSCNLTWHVPPEWSQESRDEQVRRIKETLSQEMERPNVTTEPYRILLSELAQGTNRDWNHLFATTNWDTLLEREIEALDLDVQPDWLDDSFVFHYNGSIETPSNEFRTPFLLETDLPSQRNHSVEGNIAFNRMMWQRHFIVIGMSFDCPTDRFLLDEFGSVADHLPIGESRWIILNPNKTALDAVCNRIKSVLPFTQIVPIGKKFDVWLNEGLTELNNWQVLSGQKRMP